MGRKPRTEFNMELAKELKLNGLTNKEIGEAIGCAEITCAINLKSIEVERYFKSISNKFVVYEFYDNSDNCIYIGQTTAFSKRFLTHKHKSKFFKEIHRIIAYVFDSIPDMAFFEAQLILLNKPKYNLRLKNSQPSKYSINYLHKMVFNTKGVQLPSQITGLKLKKTISYRKSRIGSNQKTYSLWITKIYTSVN